MCGERLSVQGNLIGEESAREILLAGVHPTRRDILSHLLANGRARFTQLAEATGYDPVYQCGSFYHHLSKFDSYPLWRLGTHQG